MRVASDLGPARRSVMMALKSSGRLTVQQLAARLGVSGEAVRRQLAVLRGDGLVARSAASGGGKVGRPASTFAITEAGEAVFGRDHAALTAAFLAALEQRLGARALHEVLGALTDATVARWRERIAGRPLAERVEALTGFYAEADPFASAEPCSDGYRLIERNCPYLAVAMERPVVCSVTVSALTRLLGRRVVREERFQEGDGRCVFRVYADQRIDVRAPRFAIEPPESAAGG